MTRSKIEAYNRNITIEAEQISSVGSTHGVYHAIRQLGGNADANNSLQTMANL